MARKHPEAKKPYAQPPNHPDGSKACRWCWGAVKKPRRTFCSQECVDEFRTEFDWNFCRRQVLKRDGGICALCSRDTLWLYNALRELHHLAWWCEKQGREKVHSWTQWPRGDEGERVAKRMEHRYRISRLADLMERFGIQWSRDPWEADHILARHLGGTNDLANLRTLCCPCHKAVTRQQAKERAKRRRDQKASLFGDTEGRPDAGIEPSA